jgi:hypothetical protein
VDIGVGQSSDRRPRRGAPLRPRREGGLATIEPRGPRRSPVGTGSLLYPRDRIVAHAYALLLGFALVSVTASNVATEEQRPASPAATAPQQPQLPVSLEQALYLIRSTLLSLNDANRTGNYTVLRDLAAPDFQARNSAADLAENFADLRRRHFDLFSVALAAPQLTAPPALDGNGMLRLTGFFPTKPQQINFVLLFQNAAGQWRLFGISVATPQAPAQPQAEAPKAAPTHPQAKAPSGSTKK